MTPPAAQAANSAAVRVTMSAPSLRRSDELLLAPREWRTSERFGSGEPLLLARPSASGLEQTPRTIVPAVWFGAASDAMARVVARQTVVTSHSAAVTAAANDAAVRALACLADIDVQPSHIMATIDGGVAFSFFAKSGLARVECDEDGDTIIELPGGQCHVVYGEESTAALGQALRVLGSLAIL